MTQPQPQKPLVDSSEFTFISIDLGFNLYGTVKGLKHVFLNKNMLEWFGGDSIFLGTCIHEMVESIIMGSIAQILDDMKIYDTDLLKYPKFFECIRNVSHFMTCESLNEYLYLTHNQPFSKYVSFDKNAKVE